MHRCLLPSWIGSACGVTTTAVDALDEDGRLLGCAGRQIRLIVDTGDATMEVGDIAIVPGVAHDWRAGSEGCLLFVLSVGSA
jgi:hypothetical protein